MTRVFFSLPESLGKECGIDVNVVVSVNDSIK